MTEGHATSPPHLADGAHPPVATDRLHRDAIRAFCDGQYEEALRLLSQAVLINPEGAAIIKDLGHTHLHLGHRDEALVQYQRAWEMGARFPDLAFNLGLLHLDQGRPKEAAALMRLAADQELIIKPGRFYLGLLYPATSVFMAECCLYLGLAARERGLFGGAIEHLLRAIELNPRLISAHRVLAECHLAEHSWDRAVDRCRELLTMLPTGEEISSVRLTLANALFENGQTNEAIREVQRVLEGDPTSGEALFHLKRFEDRLGQTISVRPRREVDSAEVASPLFGLTQADSLVPGLEDSELIIVGQGQAMRRVMRHARLAAASNATVLLTGENGTGKELIARAIYLYSPRRDRPFIAINCAALPETLLESELFGHERGSFTGAHAQKKGRFELADGGTLFLDEVGEMSLALQVKLLRVLQEREFTRVGGAETLRVDVRIIAATNQDLRRLITEGKFREDLYFRLHVLPIDIPPLRERREDIALLVDHFLRRHQGEGRAAPRTLTPEEMEILMDHAWPGNVRELENFIERAIVMGHSGQQLVEEIHRLRRREAADKQGEDKGVFQTSADMTLAELEHAYILRVLGDVDGNQKQASEILGINPSTLWRKMRRYQGDD